MNLKLRIADCRLTVHGIRKITNTRAYQSLDGPAKRHPGQPIRFWYALNNGAEKVDMNLQPVELGSAVTPNLNNSDQLFVANLSAVSLEKLVKSKLEVLFQQQREAQVELNGLYSVVMEQVERPLIEIALRAYNGNQVKTAQMLGINRNTLKKKIDTYKIRVKKGPQLA